MRKVTVYQGIFDRSRKENQTNDYRHDKTKRAHDVISMFYKNRSKSMYIFNF
jgi:hypothetical protein